MAKRTEEYIFRVEGGFDIQKRLKPGLSYDRQVVRFKLPDGRIARLCVAIEVENPKTDEFTYITSERGMAALGFEGLDYIELGFYPK